MAQRHLSRSIVLQTLFEWDFNGTPDAKIPEMLARNEAEFAPGYADHEFVSGLLDLIIKKRAIVDEVITKAAPEWPLEKIGVPDRNILRIGLTELLFGNREQVPPKVAINEAIELAKMYGGDNSSRFVNGVLGAVYKEIGEPGKDQVSKKKHVETDPSKFPVERSCGAVVFARHGDTLCLGLVHDVFGFWTLVKGKMKGEETEDQCVMRKVGEELGAKATRVVDLLGETEYVASHPEIGKLRKQVKYFLVEAEYSETLAPQVTNGGLDGASWFTFEELPALKLYDDIMPLIMKAITRITSTKQ